MSEVSASGTPRARRWLRLSASFAVGLAAIGCYAPALHAYFAQDDFTLLALVRLLDHPLVVFYQDHFPGSLFFRPLGVFVWWLATHMFDNAPRGHYAVNLLLHLGCVGALYAFLQRLRANALLNALWTAVYAVHPLAIGTALWLSDRFDLLGTGFSLLALTAALAHVERPRIGTLGAVIACVLLAFAGKETAIVGALAAAALIALPNGPAPLPRRQRWLGALAVLAAAGAWLAYRHALLANPQNLLLKPDTLVQVFAHGIALWARVGIEYLAVDPRRGAAAGVLLAVGALLLLAAMVLHLRGADRRFRSLGIAAALLIVILLPGPVQAPVVAVSVADLGPQTFWFDLVGESRLYHLSLAGLVAALMLLTTPRAMDRADSRWRGAPAVLVAALVALLAASIPTSHRIAHDFARRTRQQIGPLDAANAAIARLPLPAHGCQIYLLDASSIWGLLDIGDPTIKAASPAPQRIAHCLVNTERTPWGNFVRTGSIGPGDWRPLRPLTFNGVPIPWLVLDDVEVAYLNLDADIDARQMNGAFFLEYRNGVFVDVSAEVRSGARPVHFYNARPQQQ